MRIIQILGSKPSYLTYLFQVFFFSNPIKLFFNLNRHLVHSIESDQMTNRARPVAQPSELATLNQLSKSIDHVEHV